MKYFDQLIQYTECSWQFFGTVIYTFPAIISSHIDKDNLNSSFITSNVDFETLNVEFWNQTNDMKSYFLFEERNITLPNSS